MYLGEEVVGSERIIVFEKPFIAVRNKNLFNGHLWTENK